jgi:hypothetical protein
MYQPRPDTPGLFSRPRYISYWGPRIGHDAANAKWKGTIALFVAWISTLVWAPCMVIGFHYHVLIAAVVGCIALTESVVGNIYGQLQLWGSNRKASVALGLKIGGRGGTYPPTQPRLYERWCARRGLRPFEADEVVIEPVEVQNAGKD